MQKTIISSESASRHPILTIGLAIGATATFVSSAGAAVENPHCKITNGSATAEVTCESGTTPCCILGTDASGQDWYVASCCPAGKECAIEYADASVTSGGTINPNLTVSRAGCVK